MTTMNNNNNKTDFIGELIAGRWLLNGFVPQRDGTVIVLIQDMRAEDSDAALMAWFAEGKREVLRFLAENEPETSPLLWVFPTGGRITSEGVNDTQFAGLILTDPDLQFSDSPSTD